MKAAVSDSKYGLHGLENGQFWVIRDSIYRNIWIMGRFGQPSLCISPPVILGYDVLRRYNESRNWKLLIQMQLKREELTWNFPVQDRSPWEIFPQVR